MWLAVSLGGTNKEESGRVCVGSVINSRRACERVSGRDKGRSSQVARYTASDERAGSGPALTKLGPRR